MKQLTAKLKQSVPLFIILGLIIYLFGNTLIPPKGTMIMGMDIYDAYYYWKAYLGESIRSGIIPFWNPYNFSGTPFLAHPNINIFYPPNWLFIVLPLNVSFSAYFFLHMVFAGITMYWLAKKFTDRYGAFTAALIYSLGGFFAARVYSGHLEYVDAASWVPLVFGLFYEALTAYSMRKILLAAFGCAALLLCGNETFFLFAMEMVGFYMLFRFIISFRSHSYIKEIKHDIFTVGIAVTLGFGMTAMQALPRLQFISHSLRSAGVPYSVAGSGSLPISGLLILLKPFMWGMPFRNNYTYHGPWPNLLEFTSYVGVIPWILLGAFIILKVVVTRLGQYSFPKVSREIWFLILFAIPVFIIISLGSSINPNIHKILWEYTPFYKTLRHPARHLYLVAFSMSLVTGMSLSVITNKFLKIAIIAVCSIDLLIFGKQFFQLTDVPTRTFDTKLISILQNDTGIYRILPDYSVVSPVRRDLDFGAATMYKIQTTSDYNSMVLSRYYRFIDLLNKNKSSSINQYNVEIPPPNPWSDYLNFMNVKYILSDKLYDGVRQETAGKFKLIGEGGTYRLYENLTYLPRFFLVNNYRVFNNDNELENYLIGNNPDLSETVLYTKDSIAKLPVVLATCHPEKDAVKVLSYTPDEIALVSNSACDGILTTSEIDYPGWQAKIDDTGTSIYRSNYSFRSLYVPKGSHRIVLTYQPTIFYAGGLISFISLVITVYLWNRYAKK